MIFPLMDAEVKVEAETASGKELRMETGMEMMHFARCRILRPLCGETCHRYVFWRLEIWAIWRIWWEMRLKTVNLQSIHEVVPPKPNSDHKYHRNHHNRHWFFVSLCRSLSPSCPSQGFLSTLSVIPRPTTQKDKKHHQLLQQLLCPFHIIQSLRMSQCQAKEAQLRCCDVAALKQVNCCSVFEEDLSIENALQALIWQWLWGGLCSNKSLTLPETNQAPENGSWMVFKMSFPFRKLFSGAYFRF